MTKIKSLKSSAGEVFYPQAHVKGVVDDNGNSIDQIIGAVEGKVTTLGKETNNRIAETNANVAQAQESITRIDDNLVVVNDRVGDREVGRHGGMGYVLLDPTKTFAEQVTKANTIYEIRYDFDLGGFNENGTGANKVTLPNNVTLKFNGGCLHNGQIVLRNGRNYSIINESDDLIFDNVFILNNSDSYGYNGIINTVAKSKWFSKDDRFLANLGGFIGLELQENVSITPVLLQPTVSNALKLFHNFTIYGNGHTIEILNSDYNGFSGGSIIAGNIAAKVSLQIYDLTISNISETAVYSLIQAYSVHLSSSVLVNIADRCFVNVRNAIIDNCRLLSNHFVTESASPITHISITNSVIDNADYTKNILAGGDKISFINNKEPIQGELRIHSTTMFGAIECTGINNISIVDSTLSLPSTGLRGDTPDYLNNTLRYSNCRFIGYPQPISTVTTAHIYSYIRSFNVVEISKCAYHPKNIASVYDASNFYWNQGLCSIDACGTIVLTDNEFNFERISSKEGSYYYPSFGLLNILKLVANNNIFNGGNKLAYIKLKSVDEIETNNANQKTGFISFNNGEVTNSTANDDTITSTLFGYTETPEAIKNPYLGQQYYDKLQNKPVWWNGESWVASAQGAVGPQGPQGPQGNSGYQGAAGELEVVNDVIKGGTTSALSAEAGKIILSSYLGNVRADELSAYDPASLIETEMEHLILEGCVITSTGGFLIGDYGNVWVLKPKNTTKYIHIKDKTAGSTPYIAYGQTDGASSVLPLIHGTDIDATKGVDLFLRNIEYLYVYVANRNPTITSVDGFITESLSTNSLYPWRGKTIAMYGDSITGLCGNATEVDGVEGNTWKGYETTWGKLLVDSLQAKGVVRGWGGTTLTHSYRNNAVEGVNHRQFDNIGQNVAVGTEGANICYYVGMCDWQRITMQFPETIKDKIDAVILMGGTNDFDSRLIGDTTYIERTELPADSGQCDKEWFQSDLYTGGDFDIMTIQGAVCSAILKLQTWMPNAVIIVATQLSGYGTPDGENNNQQKVSNASQLNESQFADKIKEAAEYMSTPVIDINHLTGINPWNRSLYITDACHPYTTAGSKAMARAFIGEFTRIKPK